MNVRDNLVVKYKMRTVDWTVKWNVKWLEPTTLWSELQTRAIRVDILVHPSIIAAASRPLQHCLRKAT